MSGNVADWSPACVLLSQDAATLEYLLELCPVMVDTVDFSSLTTANPFMMGIGASPAKKSRHRPNVLGYLHSFVTLLAQLVEWVMAGEQDEGDQSAGDKQVGLVPASVM